MVRRLQTQIRESLLPMLQRYVCKEKGKKGNVYLHTINENAWKYVMSVAAYIHCPIYPFIHDIIVHYFHCPILLANHFFICVLIYILNQNLEVKEKKYEKYVPNTASFALVLVNFLS